MGRLAGIALLALLALPAGALGHGAGAHGTAAVRAAAITPEGECDGAAIAPDRVISGSFSSDRQGSYVLVPFDVPAGTTSVRVKYCYDANDGPLSSLAKHTLDLGIYDARPAAGALWGEDEFRGWGGSSHPDVTISAEGFKSEAQYLASPKGHVAGKTTRGFRPGPIQGGEWAVELGVAAVVPREQGDADGRVNWRVEIELSDAPAHADEPYQPAPYDTTPARSEPGWYAGDLHVHAEHSAIGDATMRETFDYAFGEAGLDFITLSDYVTDSAWGEIGRFQADYPGKLIERSSEIITYRGHTNNHGSAAYVDYRTGPVYERLPDGRLQGLRGNQPASRIFRDVHESGGWTQINHPTIFPSAVPLFPFLCRGCPWDYSDRETDYRNVDAIEIATGPAGLKDPLKIGPNPFTVTALAFYEHALSTGAKIAAVGVSDSHRAGRADDPITQAPLGQATTVVYADELSEDGIQRGVEAGHTYVKLYGNDGPDLRFEARRAGSGGPPAIMGDTLRTSGPVEFTARVLGAAPLSGRDPKKPDPYELLVTWNGLPVFVVPVLGDDFTFPFTLPVPGRWGLQLQRTTTIEAVSSPIYVEPLG
ncbi:MAG: CehA/McbA family metallohydrolase [Thermoleophilaceae bacterium]